MATAKTASEKLTYLTLTNEQRSNILREHLRVREDEHFRLQTAFSSEIGTDGQGNNPRLDAVTKEVERLQSELKALEA